MNELRTIVLEQYKLYVEMADRLSARRALANTFFLTVNTAVLIGLASKILNVIEFSLIGLVRQPHFVT
jgi:hypothetical protein